MLRAGLIGFPSTGKTSLFQLLTSAREARLTIPEQYLTDREKADIRLGCYELLLVLAEATAQLLPGEAPAAG